MHTLSVAFIGKLFCFSFLQSDSSSEVSQNTLGFGEKFHRQKRTRWDDREFSVIW